MLSLKRRSIFSLTNFLRQTINLLQKAQWNGLLCFSILREIDLKMKVGYAQYTYYGILRIFSQST